MAQTPSKHNLRGRLRDSDRFFIVNPLYGTADFLTRDEHEAFPEGDVAAYAARGYLVDPEEEQRAYRRAYLDFAEARERDEVQLFFAPWYACNFDCTYCYQSEYTPLSAAAQLPTPEVLDALFGYVRHAFAQRRTYFTLFGGEPLLGGAAHRAVIEAFVGRCAAAGLPLAVVTNGYNLSEYLDLLTTAEIREVQVTLDGVGAVHDARRPLRGGLATFARVVAGIDAALARDVPINLRIVVDRDNLAELAPLAAFASARGWTSHPLFKTQIGRNYELHSCQAQQARLYDRLEMYRDLYELAQAHPQVLELHRPALHVSRFLFDHGAMPDPIFDACPGCKTEWAFDYTGRIYPCTANVGKAAESVGTFHPAVRLDDDRIEPWQDRDVLGIDACRTCAVQLLCGGGCGAVAKNAAGRVDAPDCRPVAPLVELGMSLYFGGQPAQHKECKSCQTAS